MVEVSQSLFPTIWKMPALPLGFVMIQKGEGIIKTSETHLSSLPVSPHPICLAWQCRDRLPAHVLWDEMAPLRPLSMGDGNWIEISLMYFGLETDCS